jgi:hypothetical protein
MLSHSTCLPPSASLARSSHPLASRLTCSFLAPPCLSPHLLVPCTALPLASLARSLHRLASRSLARSSHPLSCPSPLFTLPFSPCLVPLRTSLPLASITQYLSQPLHLECLTCSPINCSRILLDPYLSHYFTSRARFTLFQRLLLGCTRYECNGSGGAAGADRPGDD